VPARRSFTTTSIEKYAKLEPATIESALKRLREPKGN